MSWLWYSKNPLSYLLLPLTSIFWLLASLRRLFYRLGLFRVNQFSAPVIVVGNISVGGTGKTPLVIWLVAFLRSRGFRPGVVSRGYGGRSLTWPQQVRPDSDTNTVGDEAVLLAERSECPVCVGPDRSAAVNALLANTDCNIVIADDGLQHYAMNRDIEIVVVDGRRRFGNGWLLPSGPLRESTARLRSADLVISLGEPVADSYTMAHRQAEIYPLGASSERRPLGDAATMRVHAIAGIGNPQKFFDMLNEAGLIVVPHAFADHHDFTENDLQFEEQLPLLMTEKDAVKCQRFSLQDAWVVRVAAQPDAAFIQALNKLLQEPDDG